MYKSSEWVSMLSGLCHVCMSVIPDGKGKTQQHSFCVAGEKVGWSKPNPKHKHTHTYITPRHFLFSFIFCEPFADLRKKCMAKGHLVERLIWRFIFNKVSAARKTKVFTAIHYKTWRPEVLYKYLSICHYLFNF